MRIDWSLKRAVTVATLLVGLLVLGCATILVLGTTRVHELVLEQTEASESARAAEELRVELLLAQRAGADDDTTRARTAGRMALLLARVTEGVHSEEERELVARATERVDAYLDHDRRPEELELAFEELSRLSRLNAEQAVSAERHAARLDRLGNVVGSATAGVLAIGVTVLVLGLRASVLAPVAKIEAALGAFTAGRRGVRAPPDGLSELRAIAERFNEMADALEADRQRRITFLAGVAHDLRTPLSAMRMGAALFSPRAPLPPEPKLRRVLAMIDRQSTRLSRMLDDIVDAARYEAGRFRLEPTPTDLCALASESIELFTAVSSRHELVLESPSGEIVAECDADRIAQVMNNLLSNAIKYSPEGGLVRVTLRKDGGFASFEVSDDGLGMTDQERREAFQPFRRLATARADIPGVGLGLHAARSIVEAQGGTIRVESEKGRGSTFRVRLPLAATVAPLREETALVGA